MTDPNPRPVSTLTRQQQADAARGEALAFYGQTLSTDHRPDTSATENPSVLTWVSRGMRAA